jgi:hypothetical protein
MKEFMMLFHSENTTNDQAPSPEQMQAMVADWQDWIGGIAAQGKFVSTNALTPVGKTVNAGGLVTDGPYAEVKEMVGGYLVCKTDSLEDAVKLTEGCPTLGYGGRVEVREVMVIPEM